MYIIICIFRIQYCSLVSDVDRSELHVPMETVQAYLKVAKFEHYMVRSLPKFPSVPELKPFSKKYWVERSPATNHSFTVGYISDGRTKCCIKTDKQLEEAYQSARNGWITLWFKQTKDEKERRESYGQEKRRKIQV